MLSFVIPAHDEELLIGTTLVTLHAAAAEVGEPFEVLVVDDASTDRTAAIAAEQGVRVLPVNFRHISATRNAGARATTGEILFFIDADTLVSAAAIRAALAALRAGAVGGGCMFRFDGELPIWFRCFFPVLIVGWRLKQIVGGCCLFCTREVFEASGGFLETCFVAEDVEFLRTLKKHGRFVIPRETVLTSGRKFRTHTFREMFAFMCRLALRGPRGFTSRNHLDMWYAPRRKEVLK